MFGFGKPSPPPELRCSFCNKSQRYVRKLIAGPNGAHICDECVDICVTIVAEAPEQEAGMPVGISVPCGLCRMPAGASETLYVRERGVLCPGCVGEVEAALGERDAE